MPLECLCATSCLQVRCHDVMVRMRCYGDDQVRMVPWRIAEISLCYSPWYHCYLIIVKSLKSQILVTINCFK